MKAIALTLILLVASTLMVVFAVVYLVCCLYKDRTKEKKEERIILERWQRIIAGEDIINDVFYPLVGNKVEIDLLLSDDMPFNYN